ncbi:hypothetical protein ACHAPC_006047 [Botrytis cinerea]|uniref:Uncharacterized protein n=1 Tax=Botryotinia fuckeliana (strain T4) TaxID=999810 RepID=G2YD77_BOTF4|nr:hypothetical protein BofuT4_P094330.1 [Botrytis cinerea T4]
MKPNNLYGDPNPSIQTLNARKMVDQQLGGESSSKDCSLSVDPSSKCAFDHLTKSQASAAACLPGSIDWQSVDERASKLLEDSDIEMEMEMEVADDEKIGGVVESVEPRVRFPVMTQGIFNPVAITQLQDDLEQTKSEVDKLRAASARSKDEITLPKRMSLSQLTEMFPEVGDQIDSKLNQKLSDARKEYEIKLKKMQDEHNDEVLRMGAVTSEKDSKLQKAEEKLKMVRQRYLYESFDDDLADIQDSHCSSRNNTNGRQDLPPLAQGVNYQAPPAFAFGSSTPLTNTFQKNDLKNPFQSNSLTNPFQNIELANGNVKKRGRGKPFQPELGRDVKRVKTEQFDN